MTNAQLERYALLGLGAVVLIVVLSRNGEGIARGAASGIVSAAGNVVTGTLSGIGQGINDSILNPAAQKLSGNPDNTLGGYIWELTHPDEMARIRALSDPVFVGGGGTFDPSAGATGSW